MIEQKLNMPKHVKRMIKEKFKLDKKIMKIGTFIDEQYETKTKPIINGEQLTMLIQQKKAMEEYGTILRERVMYDATEQMRRENKIPKDTMMSKIDIEEGMVQHFTTSAEDQETIAKELMEGIMHAE